MKRLIVTGGAGFIGSNFVRLALERLPDWRLVTLDCLTYAGNLENLAGLEEHPRHRFEKQDIADAPGLERIFSDGAEGVVHFAAESHVDRSVLDPTEFIRTNVVGTQNLIDAARRHGCGRFLQVSTDEVYGSLGERGRFTEASPLDPSSPYSASKAAADLLVLAAFRTHGFPAIVTRCSNNYGPYQFPEKLIPLMITNALEDRPLPVYGKGANVRDWIHVEDHCEALLKVFEAGRPGRVYNIGGDAERRNLEVVERILDLLGKPRGLISFVADRPGHDLRYAIDSSRIRAELGWSPRRGFEEGLAGTVRWYLEHRDWWARVKSGAYRLYYETQYGGRIGGRG